MTDFKINYKEQYDSLISYRLLNKLENQKKNLARLKLIIFFQEVVEEQMIQEIQ